MTSFQIKSNMCETVKQLTKFLVTLSLAMLFTACSTATALPQPTSAEVPMILDAFEINQELGRGVNLGNALEAPVEGEWGVVLQEEYFDLIADQGFDSVRIPIRWSAHVMMAPSELSTTSRGMR